MDNEDDFDMEIDPLDILYDLKELCYLTEEEINFLKQIKDLKLINPEVQVLFRTVIILFKGLRYKFDELERRLEKLEKK